MEPAGNRVGLEMTEKHFLRFYFLRFCFLRLSALDCRAK